MELLQWPASPEAERESLLKAFLPRDTACAVSELRIRLRHSASSYEHSKETEREARPRVSVRRVVVP